MLRLDERLALALSLSERLALPDNDSLFEVLSDTDVLKD